MDRNMQRPRARNTYSELLFKLSKIDKSNKNYDNQRAMAVLLADFESACRDEELARHCIETAKQNFELAKRKQFYARVNEKQALYNLKSAHEDLEFLQYSKRSNLRQIDQAERLLYAAEDQLKYAKACVSFTFRYTKLAKNNLDNAWHAQLSAEVDRLEARRKLELVKYMSNNRTIPSDWYIFTFPTEERSASVAATAASRPSTKQTTLRICMICNKRPRQSSFQPCRHVVSCLKCIQTLKFCCVCQQKIVRFIVVDLP